MKNQLIDKSKAIHIIRKVSNGDVYFFDYNPNKTFHGIAINFGQLINKIYLFRFIITDSTNNTIYGYLSDELLSFIASKNTVGVEFYVVIHNRKKSTWYKWRVFHYDFSTKDWEEIKG